jgi:hypothetical protein
MSDPIEEYLDRLYLRLPRQPRRARRLLAEAEQHLRDCAAEQEAAGVPAEEAQRRAVERFGVPDDVAATALSVPAVLAAVARAALGLVTVGLIAIGISGLVAAVMDAAFGTRFVGALPGQHYSTAACRHFLAVQPSARSCTQAAMLENSADAVSLRLLAGGVGLVCLGALLVVRRMRRGRSTALVVSPTLVRTAGTFLFGAAAVLLLGQSVDLMTVAGGDGAGYFLSGGIVALAVAAAYAVAVLRSGRTSELVDLR